MFQRDQLAVPFVEHLHDLLLVVPPRYPEPTPHHHSEFGVHSQSVFLGRALVDPLGHPLQVVPLPNLVGQTVLRVVLPQVRETIVGLGEFFIVV